MPDKPDTPFKFWEELKRRKVVRVITVYAAAAFVIIELTNNITEPLSLPDWVPTLVIVLLAIGFLIAIVMSWIFDITPEGIQKTKRSSQKSGGVIRQASTGWKISTYVSILLIIAFVVFYIVSNIKQSADFSKLEKSIAVLPFENLSSDEEQAYFGDAMTDEIIMQLKNIKEFRVLSRTSTLQYKDSKKSIPAIGEELNVNYLVEGTVQRQEDNVRIRVQVIRTKNESHIWGESYDKHWNDIFSIQNDIALNVSRELKTTLTTSEKEQIKKISTNSSEAYELYLQGRYYWNMRTKKGLKNSLELFEKAIDIDNNFALAYSGLADAYNIAADWNYIDYNTALNLSMQSALTAIMLDNNISEPYAALGLPADYLFHDFNLVELCFKRAIAINPDYSSAYQWYALFLMRRGEHEEAIKSIERALELDPKSLIINYATGLIYYYTRDYEKSITQLEKTEIIDRDSSIFNTINRQKIMCYLNQQEYEKVLSEYKFRLKDDSLLEDYNIYASEIYEENGKNGLINYIISCEQQKEDFSHELLATLFSHIDKKEEAMDIIKDMIDKKISHFHYIHIEPAFDTLHSEQRFIELLGRINVESY